MTATGPIIYHFMQVLESHLYATTMCAATMDLHAVTNPVKPDRGYNFIIADPSAEKGTVALVAKEMERTIRLNFVGKIVRAPVKNSIKICSAFDNDFYLDGSAVDSYIVTDSFVPAWMVPPPPVRARGKKRKHEKPDGAEATEAAEAASEAEIEPTMHLKESTFEFEYKWNMLMKKNSLSVGVDACAQYPSSRMMVHHPCVRARSSIEGCEQYLSSVM